MAVSVTMLKPCLKMAFWMTYSRVLYFACPYEIANLTREGLIWPWLYVGQSVRPSQSIIQLIAQQTSKGQPILSKL